MALQWFKNKGKMYYLYLFMGNHNKRNKKLKILWWVSSSRNRKGNLSHKWGRNYILKNQTEHKSHADLGVNNKSIGCVGELWTRWYEWMSR